MSIRETILQRKAAPVPVLLSDGTTLFARLLSCDEFDAWRAKESAALMAEGHVEYVQFLLGFIVTTAVDEHGAQAFTEADIAELRKQDILFIKDLYMGLLKANTVSPADAEKNS